ncbi:MAG: hypothetical protein ABGZ53_11475, partial [Fuerstiella sp.]
MFRDRIGQKNTIASPAVRDASDLLVYRSRENAFHWRVFSSEEAPGRGHNTSTKTSEVSSSVELRKCLELLRVQEAYDGGVPGVNRDQVFLW